MDPRSAHRWRLVLGDGTDPGPPTPQDGPRNMAIDQALLRSVSGGASPVLRLYRWSPATLSFGRNQPARGLYDEEAAAARGIAFVRRPTGGQAVLHHEELTYAVVAPVAAIGKPRAAYEWINRALVAALREIGVDAALAGDGGGDPPIRRTGGAPSRNGWLEACFRRPERGEVMVAGRKLIGSAQRREGRTILQHGSILLGGSQAAAEELLVGRARPAPRPGEGAADPAPGWTTVAAELSARPTTQSVVDAVRAEFEEILGTSLAPTTLSFDETAAVRTLRPRFESGGWTWRR